MRINKNQYTLKCSETQNTNTPHIHINSKFKQQEKEKLSKKGMTIILEARKPWKISSI